MTVCEENPYYSVDHFANQHLGKTPSRDIDDQLKWLEAELAVAERQVECQKTSLLQKIKAQQRTELRREAFLNSSTNQKRLSEHFAQCILHLELL